MSANLARDGEAWEQLERMTGHDPDLLRYFADEVGAHASSYRNEGPYHSDGREADA